MGTVNAILLHAEHYITWVHATFLWATSKWPVQPRPASRCLVSSTDFAFAKFSASRGSSIPQVPR